VQSPAGSFQLGRGREYEKSRKSLEVEEKRSLTNGKTVNPFVKLKRNLLPMCQCPFLAINNVQHILKNISNEMRSACAARRK
jgi:hypothetical protein